MPASRLRRWAASWRRLPVHPQWLMHTTDAEAELRRALERHGERVLDIGCSDRALARLVEPNGVYVGLDYPATATGLYGTRPDVYGDAADLPFSAASFDTVILKDVLEHVRRPTDALAEAGRVLRPDGRLVLWVPFLYPVHDHPHDYQRWTASGLRLNLEGAGFAVDACRPVLNPAATAALLTSLSYADAIERILAGRRWLLPLVPFLALGVLAANLLGKGLAALLPASDFMPVAYRVTARRTSAQARAEP